MVKNKIEVLIGGSVYTLVGEEREEYMQRVALYIDKKMDEVKKTESSKKLSTNLIAILTSINVADDLFKLKHEFELLSAKVESDEQEINNLKRELERYKDELGKMQSENLEYEKLLEQNQLELLRYKNK